MDERRDQVVFSNGFHKMHLTIAAREASDRGQLSLALTGVYPTPSIKRWVRATRADRLHRLARLLERDEGIPKDRLDPIFVPEMLDEAARLFRRVPMVGHLYERVSVANMRLYGRLAARRLGKADDAGIFHFRAGFGGDSVDRARELGMVILCDHALAHPSLLDELVANRGRLKEGVVGEPASKPPARPDSEFLGTILSDIERSDAVLVNSDFVKDTFVTAGYPAERIHVAYLGIDNNFLAKMPPVARPINEGKLRLVYASRLEPRKGAEVLIEALQELDDQIDWSLDVAGPVSPEIRVAHGAFFTDKRVRVLGPLTRPEFQAQLLSHPVFVFPSYAEGSARAVFEALACGCYVITTPNSGSIVENDVHGAVVAAGDVRGLAAAIVTADRDRELTAEIGSRNARIVRERYTQADWGDALAAVYRHLLSSDGAVAGRGRAQPAS